MTASLQVNRPTPVANVQQRSRFSLYGIGRRCLSGYWQVLHHPAAGISYPVAESGAEQKADWGVSCRSLIWRHGPLAGDRIDRSNRYSCESTSIHELAILMLNPVATADESATAAKQKQPKAKLWNSTQRLRSSLSSATRHTALLLLHYSTHLEPTELSTYAMNVSVLTGACNICDWS
jgi:hypothetical protein